MQASGQPEPTRPPDALHQAQQPPPKSTAVLAIAKQPSASTGAICSKAEPAQLPLKPRRLPERLTQPAPPPPQLPPLSLSPCRVVYVATSVEVEWWAHHLLGEEAGVSVLGFDIEWKVTFKKGERQRPPALVQLAYKRRAPPQGQQPYACVLLHVAASGATPALRSLLQSPRPLKAGVGVHGDGLKLGRDWGCALGGEADLSEAALERGINPPCDASKWSLSGLAQRVLRRRMAKQQALRLSDWEMSPLSREQGTYAALDAFACLRIHEELQQLPVLQSVNDAREAAAAAAVAAARQQAQAHTAAGATSGDEGLALAGFEPVQLKPTKLKTSCMFHEQGNGAAIAAASCIQPATVLNYLTEAVAGAHACCRSRSGVLDAAPRAVGPMAIGLLCLPPAASVPHAAACVAAPAKRVEIPKAAADGSWATGVFAGEASDEELSAKAAAALDAAAAAAVFRRTAPVATRQQAHVTATATQPGWLAGRQQAR